MRFPHLLRRFGRDAEPTEERNLRERGAAALEFALIAPFFFLVVFGGIEIGLMFRSHLALEDMSRSAARVASIERDAADADRVILSRIESKAAPLNGDITRVVIFSAPTLDAQVPVACTTANASLAGQCNIYEITNGNLSTLTAAGSTLETGLTAAERDQWQNLGIYIEYDYQYVTGFFDSITLSTTSVEVVELDL